MKIANTAQVTPTEIKLLAAIRDDEYRTGDLNEPVWSHNITPPAGMTRRSMGGVFASLSKKGLVVLGGSGKESTVAFTASGIELVRTIA